MENSLGVVKKYIVVRTQYEGWHRYPNAGTIDARIRFLENKHRHMFHVTAKMSVTHADRELEFFLVKWALSDYLDEQDMDNKSCEMIAEEIINNHLIPTHGNRYYQVTVSEDNESDGIVEWYPA